MAGVSLASCFAYKVRISISTNHVLDYIEALGVWSQFTSAFDSFRHDHCAFFSAIYFYAHHFLDIN